MAETALIAPARTESSLAEPGIFFLVVATLVTLLLNGQSNLPLAMQVVNTSETVSYMAVVYTVEEAAALLRGTEKHTFIVPSEKWFAANAKNSEGKLEVLTDQKLFTNLTLKGAATLPSRGNSQKAKVLSGAEIVLARTSSGDLTVASSKVFEKPVKVVKVVEARNGLVLFLQ